MFSEKKKYFISVVICTYNRHKDLKNTLDAVVRQENNVSFDYEIIVVDNNSTDATKDVVEHYASKCKGLKYVFEQYQGLSNARNSGIRAAEGEIIAFTDDDVILDEKWLSNIVAVFQKHDCDAVGGRVLPVYFQDTPRWIKENKDLLSGPIVSYDYGERIDIYDSDRMLPFIGASMAFRKYCFDKYGLFNSDIGLGKATMGDDTEFFGRLTRDVNAKIYYCGQALAWHRVDRYRTNLGYISKWCIALGKYIATEDYAATKRESVFYFGIPRYLIKKLVKNGFLLIFKIFDKRTSIRLWLQICTNIGMVLRFRQIDRGLIND